MRLRLAARLLVALLAAGPAWSQGSDFCSTEQLHLDHVEPAPGQRRVVELYLRPVCDNLGPVDLLTKKSVVITQDHDPVEGFDLEQLSDSRRGTAAVFAIDVSKSVGEESFDRAQQAVLEIVEKRATFDRIAIVAIGGQAEVIAPFAAEPSEASEALQALQLDQNALQTVLFDGVQKAVDLLREDRDLPRRQYVVVISDAEGTAAGGESMDEVIASAKGDEGEPRIPIYSIGHTRFDPKDLDALRKLSKETGGNFFDAGDIARITSDLKTIIAQNSRSYVLTYEPSFDGRRHEIEAQVEGHGDKRAAVFPKRSISLWWFGGAGLAVLVVGALVVWLLLHRGAGRLVFVGGERNGETIPLQAGVIQIGGLPENDVVIANMRVSKYHARVLVDGRHVEIEDLGSTNGTAVNGERIERCQLHAGDRILLAQEVELEYQR